MNVPNAVTSDNMVIEETTQTKIIEPEIITVDDLIGGSSGAASVPSGSPNVDKLEQWIRILDKGLSIADRGITILGKADSIVRNISEVIMKQHEKQQPQQQQQFPNVLPNPPYEVIQVPAKHDAATDAAPQQQITNADAGPDAAHEESVPAGAGKQLITAERISGVLSMLLGQCPNMTVRELKELIDRNPDSINSMLSFLK